MGFISFAGRVLFSAVFILAAWQKINDFGTDGGAAVKSMEPKLALFKNHVTTLLGVQVPEVEVKHILMVAIGLEGIGGILFIFGSTLGAYLLLIFLATVTPIMHDFYNYDMARPEYVSEFIQFLKNLSLFGAMLFFLGMKNSFAKKPKKKVSKPKTN
uniref:TSA: Wollemia nobilis Ref_Wollemi_Transcript_22665_978 transcribed RNA sequence n=1 Tax=Wollemia nobilis TaxID=56998 RepID=A0A0C9S4Q8_9CONI